MPRRHLAKKASPSKWWTPRTLVPLDKDKILESVAKTGRLVVVDLAHKTCSAASEIAAIVAMEGFWHLQAPIQRLGTANVTHPLQPRVGAPVLPHGGDHRRCRPDHPAVVAAQEQSLWTRC